MPDDSSARDAAQTISDLKQARERILEQVHRVIVGQDRVVDELLTALFCDGHCLLVGVPGLAKTLLISTIARVLDLKFNRIQFTPDLMPSDITGTEILEEDRSSGKRAFRFVKGPVFANLVLADEINRTPPKTQAALLQSMQEKAVTVAGQTFALEPPFFVLATQNPIEMEGTYPLPEAQLDRFMFNIYVDYPSEAEERQIVATTTGQYEAEIRPVLSGADIVRIQKTIRRVPVSDHVVAYAVTLARQTRPSGTDQQFIKDWVAWGAGPRASQYLIMGAKARAVLLGRPSPACEDVRQVALAVLRHRVLPNFNAEADGIRVPTIIQRLLEAVPEPKDKALPETVR
jgi:MoxR-like ATPase